MKTRKRKAEKPIRIHANCVAREHLPDEILDWAAGYLLRMARDLACGGRGDGLSPPRLPGSPSPWYVRITEAPETKKEIFIAIREDNDEVHFVADNDKDRLMASICKINPDCPVHEAFADLD